MFLDPLSPSDLSLVVPPALLLGLWHLGCGLGLIAGRRVPPGLVFAPMAVVLSLAAARVLWTATTVPWDPDVLFGDVKVALATPDARVRLLLPLVLAPALVASALTAAVAAPLRGPRLLWPAGLGALLAGPGLVGITVGSALDLNPSSVALLLAQVGPLTAFAVLASVRGPSDGPAPEAGVIGALALCHAVSAGALAVLARARFADVGRYGFHPDEAAWRVVGLGVAWLASVGLVALACTGATDGRARATGVGVGVLSLLPWVPMALFGSLGRLS